MSRTQRSDADQSRVDRSAAKPSTPDRSRRNGVFLLVGLAVALVLAAVVSSLASGSPDGLESVAESQGFLDEGRDSTTAGSPLSDYGTAGVENDMLSVAIAGTAGVLITFALGACLFWFVRRRNGSRGTGGSR
jgi:hypothetical protein